MRPSSFLWLAALAALMSFVVARAAESGSHDDKDRAIDILSTEGQHGWLKKVLQVGGTARNLVNALTRGTFTVPFGFRARNASSSCCTGGQVHNGRTALRSPGGKTLQNDDT